MLDILNIFAHAGEEHVNASENLNHLAPWYFQLLNLIIALAVIGYLVWILSSKKRIPALTIMTFTTLIIGFATYNISTFISVTSVTIGIFLAGFLTILGLSNDKSKK